MSFDACSLCLEWRVVNRHVTAGGHRLCPAGLQNVREAVQPFGLKRLSLGSSGSVYGGLPAGPFREDMPLPVDFRTQVEAFKKAMESRAFHYAARANLEVISLRIASVYGPLYYSIRQ